jgi:hypothetical protein
MKIIYFFFSISLILCFGSAKSATFVSKGTGNFSSASTWTVTAGTDSDGKPDSDDNLTILSGHVVKLDVNSEIKSLTVNLGGSLNGFSRRLGLRGNFTNNGTVSNTTNLVFRTTCSFSSASTFTCTGSWYIQANVTLTVLAGTVINRFGEMVFQSDNADMVNNGAITLRTTGALLGRVKFLAATGGNSWINNSGSSLSMQANITLAAGTHTFNCSASNNSVIYTGTSSDIFNTTYQNLTVSSATTAALSQSLNVLGNLSLSNASLTLSTGGFDIAVGGNLTNNCGNFDWSSGGKIIFNGASTQTVAGTSNTLFYDMELSKPTTTASVVFNTNQTVTNDLIMTQGNLNSNNHLILGSDINATARLAPITSTANVSFTGNMIIQKFIDDQPYNYHDLSSPVQSTTVSDWDNEIYISGIDTWDGSADPAGPDGNVLNFANTMHTYNEATNSFDVVTGSSTPLVVAKGYQLLLADNLSSWFAKVIDTRGVPNYGNVTVSGLAYTAGQGLGWHLLGNPYASPINFSSASVTRTSVKNFVYFTDGGNYTAQPANTTISALQGFYVERSSASGSGSVTFREGAKVNDHTVAFSRKKPNYDIKLIINSNLTPFHHENEINFSNDATVGYDDELDAGYHKFPIPVAPAIYMMEPKSELNLVRNVMNSVQDEVTIPLGIFTPKSGIYYLDASILNRDAYNYVWIENIKTGEKFDLNNSVAIEGEELGTNKNYVLRLSKNKQNSSVSAAILETDLIIFSTENTINLKSSNADHNISEVLVYDMTGKLMLTQNNVTVKAGADITKIDISTLASGIYIVKAFDQEGRITSKKLVK